MKRCPLCGKEYEVENTCPICNVLLIDTELNRAVNNESEKEKKRRIQQEQRVKAKEEKKAQVKETASQAVAQGKSIDPKLLAMIGGGIVVIIVVVIILKTVLGNKAEPEEIVQSGAVVEDEDDTSAVELDEKDFVRNELVVFETDSFKFQLPAYWRDLCEVKSDDESIAFHQKKSSEYGGYLFGITVVENQDLEQLNAYDVIEKDGNMTYVMELPTDVSYDTSDAYAQMEYERLFEDREYVFDTFEGLKESSALTQGDYIIADSSTRTLTTADLTSLTQEELLYARNEIYARHGRRFQDETIQKYFDSKSWYQGTIAPENFQDNMLNDVERANAQTILSYEKSKGYR